MLSWGERLALWNQYEILKRLNPSDADEYNKNQEIVADGYEQFYPDLNPSISEKSVSPEASQEVMDILDMFRAIKFSCKRLGYTPKTGDGEFDGFDANASEPHYGFARFLRDTLGRWEELKDRPHNSHSSASLDIYRRMLGRWKRVGRTHELSGDQIEQIIAGP